MMASIVAEHISKRYYLRKKWRPPSWTDRLAQLFIPRQEPLKKQPPREVWALKDVCFDVDPGTVLGIIGPNGAGKTTLLKILGRVTLPTSGRAVVRGRVVSLLEVGAGFQPELTGRENIFLHAALYGIPRREVLQRLDRIVEWAELSDFIDTPVKRYSSGMYLRLAFSVAINMEPDIVLADEVLAVGDLAFQERCIRRVEEAGRQGLTVLFVSHDMAAITRICDRVIWLNAGQIVADGPPHEVVKRYEEAAWTVLSQQRNAGGRSVLSNDFGEIIAVHLLSTAGQEIGALRVSEEAVLQVVYRVFAAGLEVRCSLELTTRGILVFRSVQPEVLRVTAPGTYKARLRIPAHLLAETLYSVNVKISITPTYREREPRPLALDNALSFRVYNIDSIDSARGTYTGPLDGVITPKLEWHVEEERPAITL